MRQYLTLLTSCSECILAYFSAFWFAVWALIKVIMQSCNRIKSFPTLSLPTRRELLIYTIIQIYVV